MANLHQPQHRDEFEVALFCALPKESNAITSIFDGFWGDYGKVQSDGNSYKTGWIGGHNVVLVFAPNMGKVASSSVAAQLKISFTRIRLCLVAGICGGVPTRTSSGEIFLGDVLISSTLKQFDFGRLYSDGLKPKDTIVDNLGRPNPEIRSFLHGIQAGGSLEQLVNQTASYLQDLSEQKRLRCPTEDTLYPPHSRHKHQDPRACEICAECKNPTDPVCEQALKTSCTELGCNTTLPVFRSRSSLEPLSHSWTIPIPSIHFGCFASGDCVVKSGLDRDRIATQNNVIGFEMEGAGVWDQLPTIIVKSVCDYADSHKNKVWQEYAALTAAASVKAILNAWPVSERPSALLEGSLLNSYGEARYSTCAL
jgi:nucleoside phosphorylase